MKQEPYLEITKKNRIVLNKITWLLYKWRSAPKGRPSRSNKVGAEEGKKKKYRRRGENNEPLWRNRRARTNAINV